MPNLRLQFNPGTSLLFANQFLPRMETSSHHQSGIKSPLSGPACVLAIARIRQRVVHMKAIEPGDWFLVENRPRKSRTRTWSEGSPPAPIVQLTRGFETSGLHCRSPDFGEPRCRSRPLKMTICSHSNYIVLTLFHFCTYCWYYNNRWINHEQCKEDGCLKQPRFNLPTEATGLYLGARQPSPPALAGTVTSKVSTGASSVFLANATVRGRAWYKILDAPELTLNVTPSARFRRKVLCEEGRCSNSEAGPPNAMEGAREAGAAWDAKEDWVE